MDVDVIAVLGRSTERILIIVFCGMSLWFGWRLFYRANDEADHSANISWKSFAFGMKKVGPGIFFAFFGAAVLATALRSPLNVKPDDDQAHIVYLSNTNKTDVLLALNTAYRLASLPTKELIVQADRDAFAAQKDLFDIQRLSIVQTMVSKDDFYNWKNYRDRLATEPESIPVDKLAGVTKVQALLDRWR